MTDDAVIRAGDVLMQHGLNAPEQVIYQAARAALSAALRPAPGVVECERCQGNGEIVTDWDRYLKPAPGDKGDEAVADCPDCDGIGKAPAPAAGMEAPVEARLHDLLKEARKSSAVVDVYGGKNDLIRRLADALEAALPHLSASLSGEWRPIETAHAGKLLLLFEPHEQGGFIFVGAKNGAWFNNLDQRIQQPTHWMPLPASPRGEGGEG